MSDKILKVQRVNNTNVYDLYFAPEGRSIATVSGKEQADKLAMAYNDYPQAIEALRALLLGIESVKQMDDSQAVEQARAVLGKAEGHG